MPHLEKRAVAASFIFQFPDDDLSRKPQVALFRRSGHVKTYKHRYAPVSGSVDPTDANPLATAWRELHEETTLTSASVRLFRTGKPYSFADAAVGREWTVHPFSFILKSSEEGGRTIKLDWEHDEYQWFDPEDVTDDESFQGVPRLRESLGRVWFELDLGDDAGSVLRKGLKLLRDDHESGARQLAAKALDVFVDVLPRIDASAADAWWRNVRFAGWHLWKNGRECMGAPVLSVVLSSLDIISKKSLPGGGAPLPPGFVEDARTSIKEFGHTRQQSVKKMGDAFASFLKEHYASGDQPVKIVTLSSSSTITACITQALTPSSEEDEPPLLDLRILESRPLFEGVQCAQRIFSVLKNGKFVGRSNGATTNRSSSVTLYTDASAALAAKDADVLLLGADVIDKTGNVSNKTGSLPAVLSAKHASPGVRVVVLSEKEKVLPLDPPGHEENDPLEVSRGWGDDLVPGGVEVKNVYFEWVDEGLVDHYVTEDGVEETGDIEKWAKKVGQRVSRFFDDI